MSGNARVNAISSATDELATSITDRILAHADGLIDRFADVFSISNKKNREIAFALHLENGEYTSGSYFSYFIWGSTQIKAEYRNAPDGVPVSSNQWFLYSDDFIGFLKRSKELGDQRTDVTYMERTGVSDMYEVIQWPNKLIGNISTGTIVWEQDFILYRYAQYYTMLAELRYHRKDYSGALTALNTLAHVKELPTSSWKS